MLKKFTCTALAVLIMISGMICVSATSKADFSLENAKEYFTLMNGCSRTALKNYNDEDTVDAIVYCGLDLSSPKIMFYLSMFYSANDIDTEKITADPAYCTQIIGNLNAYLKKMCENNHLPYELNLSIGFAKCDNNHTRINALVNEADQMQYVRKNKHHAKDDLR